MLEEPYATKTDTPMKTLATLLIALALIALTWYSLGWISLLVLPSIALFALMTFAPLIVDWAQQDELRNSGASH